MKKIEKLTIGKLEGSLRRVEDKINEIISRLNQEVSQPEEEPLPKSVELMFQEKVLESKLDTTAGETINHTETYKEVENNTEEENWDYMRREIIGAIARGYCAKGNENKILDSDLCLAMVDEVMKVVEQLISEKSFSRDELLELKLLLNDAYNEGNIAFEDVSLKINRLLRN